MPVPVEPPRFADERRSAYVRTGHRRVRGYLDRFNAGVIDALLRHQAEIGVRGSLGEIGVHHGQLFLVAFLNSRRDERVFAVDVFGEQELNVDASGRGDEAIFRSNLERHAGSLEGVEIFACSSMDLTPEILLERCGPARFISIDGGHTEENTLNDLRIARDLLTDGGLVVIDDCFNQSWPGVLTGFAKYMLAERGRLHPFLITPNKVFLSDEASAAEYLHGLEKELGLFRDKRAHLFESPVEIYGTARGSSRLYYRARGLLRRQPRVKGAVARLLRMPSAPGSDKRRAK